MTLRGFQQGILERRAFDEGQGKDLVYFLAVLRDRDALQSLRERIAASDEAGLLALDLMALAEDPAPAPELVARVAAHDDPWFFHTLAKALLLQGHFKEALLLAQQRLKQVQGDTAVINLVAKWLLSQGQYRVAEEVARRSLKFAPRQEDIEAVADLARRGEPLPYTLGLDILPGQETVTFYLPVYNVERYIRLAIEGVCAQSHPLEEVIVVDDGTPDNSVAVARDYPVRILDHGGNRGLAAARNTAFRHAVSRFVGAVDTDAHPDPEFTRNILIEFEQAAPCIAGAGGKLIEVHQEAPPDRWRARHMAQQQGPRRICTPEGLFGSNTLFVREAVLAAGGYDDQHRTNGEDVALCHALRGAGYGFFYTPNAIAYHERTDTIRSVVRTSWSWVAPGKRQHGYYTDPALLLYGFEELLQSIRAYLVLANRAEDYECGYIDLLLLFHMMCLDLNETVRAGGLTPAEARVIEDGVFDTLSELPAGLAARIAADSQDLLHAPDGTPVRDGIRAWLAGFQEKARAAWATLPPEFWPRLVKAE